jgi:hypothetical protein
MRNIYNMASGKPESPPAKASAAAAPDRFTPALALQEQPDRGAGTKALAISVQLVRALLRKN